MLDALSISASVLSKNDIQKKLRTKKVTRTHYCRQPKKVRPTAASLVVNLSLLSFGNERDCAKFFQLPYFQTFHHEGFGASSCLI